MNSRESFGSAAEHGTGGASATAARASVTRAAALATPRRSRPPMVAATPLDGGFGRSLYRHLGDLVVCRMGGSPAASAAARLSQRSDEPGQVLQHGPALADGGQPRCRTEPLDGSADHDPVLDDAGARRPWSRRDRQRRPRRGDPLFPSDRASDPADGDPARPGLADSVAAGRDLHLRDRQRPGDLYGVHRALLSHDLGDDHPDRRGQPQLHQRRADHGRQQTPDLPAGHPAGDPPRAIGGAALNLFGAWMVVLIAEATGVGFGLGQVISMARNTFNPGLVYFNIVIIGLLG